MRITKKNLKKLTKKLSNSKTFVGCFSHLDNFIIKAKKYSFLLVCKFNVVCFYVTEKTFEIFDPAGFLETLKCLRSKTVQKLKSLKQHREILCNPKTQDSCPTLCANFIRLRDAGNSFMTSIKKLL